MCATTTALLRATTLLLCLVTGTRQLSIKEFVVPKTVEVGNDAELRCQYELGVQESETALFVKWWWTPSSSPSDYRKQIYQRIAGQPAESIHHVNASKIEIKQNDTIVLTDVNPVDSGTYECEVSNIDEIRKHDTLIVFTMGTGPEINYTLVQSDAEDEEDQLLIECEAEDVAPLPDIILTFQGENINISKIVEDSNQDGLYKIYVNATVNTSDIVEGEIRCELFFANLEIAPYVDVETYTPPGRDASTTEPPDEATEPDATPDSLLNSSDDGNRLHCSLALLTFAAILTHLQSTL